jgi:hypothetical protein
LKVFFYKKIKKLQKKSTKVRLLTPEELWQLVLTTLGSHTAGNPPAIDQIEVFGMRKVLNLLALLVQKYKY